MSVPSTREAQNSPLSQVTRAGPTSKESEYLKPAIALPRSTVVQNNYQTDRIITQIWEMIPN